MADDSRGSGAEHRTEPFPRGLALPRQSPLFWVADKDRYLRQLMIRDLEAQTGRRLLVYFADCESDAPGAQIHPSDDQFLVELLGPDAPVPTDLLLETNGGSTDATEKLVGLLRRCAPDLRVIVPRRAKSNGTLLALAAREIVMGVASELGPIDPFIDVSATLRVPAHVLVGEGIDPMFRQTAQDAVTQTKTLATTLLKTGMLRDRAEHEIDQTVGKLASRAHFHSHGSVIDAEEAVSLGLAIARLEPDDDLWQRLWLLRCMYWHDLRSAGQVKIFEGRIVSNALLASHRTVGA